jgi:hypothetical protein
MALLPKYTITQSTDCSYIYYIDSTGSYSELNPEGYGAPNPTAASVITYVLEILQPEATIPFTFTFTIVNLVITACTQTDPDGTVTNIYADLLSTVFPFTSTYPFKITGEMLTGEEDSLLDDGVYNADISLTSTGPATVTNDQDFLLQCQVCKCKDQKFAELSPADCNCECGKIEKLMSIDAFIQAANSAMDVGYSAEAQVNITKAADLCEGDCGCG